MIICRLCGADITYSYGDSNLPDICAGCKHTSDWIKAEYEVMGWPQIKDVTIEPIIKE